MHRLRNPRRRHAVRADWRRDIARRLFVLWPLKALGTPAILALFFFGYFGVLRHPIAPPYVMPLIAPDHWIAFVPASYAIYVSLWVYVSLPPALLGNLRVLLHYAAWMSFMCVACLVFFWLFPTQTPAVDIDWGLYPSLSTIKSLDATGNAFPSLHVASSVFSAFWLHRLLVTVAVPAWLRWLNVLQCVAITWSTMATLQHVALDVIAGAGVGAAFALASLRSTRRAARPLPL
jgi:membrane-associated phospholipid phosphatase